MEHDRDRPLAIEAAAAPPRSKPSAFPEPFASRVSGRETLARLRAGGASALHHRHSNRTAGDEPVYPRDDLRAVGGPGGRRVYVHEDGTPS